MLAFHTLYFEKCSENIGFSIEDFVQISADS
jgi:hypothetical protein